MDRAEFSAQTGVSRETLDRLDIFAAELTRWNRAINLVAPGTIRTLWSRHILDSWQLCALAGAHQGTWLDLGSGGGLPGLIVAAELWPLTVTMIESDQRKSVFLREAARKMGVTVDVKTARIESVDPFPAATISARALAPLPDLLRLAHPFSGPDTNFLFLKGQDVDKELTQAAKYWNFEAMRHPSLSDPRGCLVSIRELSPHG